MKCTSKNVRVGDKLHLRNYPMIYTVVDGCAQFGCAGGCGYWTLRDERGVRSQNHIGLGEHSMWTHA